jgi:hypothetical protein
MSKQYRRENSILSDTLWLILPKKHLFPVPSHISPVASLPLVPSTGTQAEDGVGLERDRTESANRKETLKWKSH